MSALTKTATVSRPEACLTPDRYLNVQSPMPPKKSSARSPKATRKSPRQKGTPASVPDVVPERLGDEDEEDDVESEDDASVDENPHAGV